MDIAAEGAEKLSSGDVPIPVAPGTLPPSGQRFEHEAILRIVMGIVLNPGGNEACGGLVMILKGNDVIVAIPGVSDSPGVGGGVNAGPPALAVRTDLGTA